jgi:hypothetical protein
LKETLHPCWIQECPVVPVGPMAGPVVLEASMLDVGDTPLEVMGLKPAALHGLLVRLVNPTAADVATAVTFPGLPDGTFRAVRTRLDEAVEISSADLGLGKPLDLRFRPFEIQTWKIEPC